MGVLPADRGAFVGRDRECDRLLEARDRLVTIVAPAGMGKTRLALEVARRIRASCTVVFADLTAERDAHGICDAVARSLRLKLFTDADGESVEQVARRLGALGPACVVLDNFEHLLEFACTTVAPWLGAAPGVRFVVTSRERLHLGSERVFELGPLPVPRPAARGQELQTDALVLFVDRVKAVRPAWEPAPEELVVVADIVRRLEGIPLAVELAAARAAARGTRDVLGEIVTTLEGLSTDLSDTPPRHRTLHAAVLGSWSLLDPTERALLTQLSVFRGGFDAAAVSAVAPHAGDSGAVLGSLRDKSLLFAVEVPASSCLMRWSMYEYVRQFAAARLAGAALADARARHARYFVDRGGEWAEDVERDPLALEGVALEVENLLAAQDHALSIRGRQAAEDALRIALTLDPLLEDRGPPERRDAVVRRSLEHPDVPEADVSLVARAWRARALCELDRREVARARSMFDHALGLVRGKGLVELEARLAVDMGWLAIDVGELELARTTLDAAVAASRSAGDLVLEAQALHHLGRVADHLGSQRGQEEKCFQALALLRMAGGHRCEGLILMSLSDAQHQLRRPTWLQYGEKARDVSLSFGNDRLLARAESSVGGGFLDLGEVDRAETHVRRGLALVRAVGDRYFEAMARAALAQIEFERGRFLEALSSYEAALGVFRRGLSRRWGSIVLAHCSAARAKLGDFAGAEEALATAREQGIAADLTLEALLRIYPFYLDLERRAALGAMSGSGLAARLARARPWIAERWTEAQAAESDDVRFALRHTQRAIDELSRSANATDARAWLVSSDASAFRPPGRGWVSLERRHAMRRILLALVRLRQQSPGAALSKEALVVRGWPGERVSRSSGLNRLHFTLATLRKLGLAPLLETQEHGYRLDPRLSLSVVSGARDGAQI